MKRFVISEDERARILSMHESATKRQYLSEQDSVVPTAQEKLVDYKGFMDALSFKADQNIFPSQDSFNSLAGSIGNVPAFQTIENAIQTACSGGGCLSAFLESPLGKAKADTLPENSADKVKITNNTLFPALLASAVISSIRGGQYSPNAAREAYNLLKVNTDSLGGGLAKITNDMFKRAVDGTIEYIKSGEFETYNPNSGIKIG